jgi:hypothetical protein
MDIQRLLHDYKIPFVTEGHKHSREGWVNIPCPFCSGNPGYHLGIHEDGNGAHCWRCGAHPVPKVLSAVLHLPESKVRAIMHKYKGRIHRRRTDEAKVSIFPLRLPKPNSALTGQYKRYLEKRGFDPDKLEKEWGLLQTGPVSLLDNISYSHRILIPIYWDGGIVSFQARDITDKSPLKYLACPKRREKIHHKNILYGKQEYWKKSKGIIVVEGATDVWRLGAHAAATFGIEFKMEQILLLSRLHNRFFIIFDDEPQAQRQAKVLATKLKTLGKEAYIEKIEGDPGSMKQEDANHLVKYLLGGGKAWRRIKPSKQTRAN